MANTTAPTEQAHTSPAKMSLEEARSVRWLRNNPRPLGELLDQGYLTELRLAWAAERAYEPRLKQAAAVLLEWIQRDAAPSKQPPPEPAVQVLPELQAKLTLEQARATRWPFRPFRDQPMGALIDARQLTVKDLAYAVENAWDERVRQAATVLLAVRLNQVVQEPTPPVGPLTVVSGGRSYSEAKQFSWTYLQGMLMGALAAVWVLLTIQVIRSLVARFEPESVQAVESATRTPAGVIALLILLAFGAGIGLLTNRLFDMADKRIHRQIENYRKGQEGEEKVVDALRQNLDGHWTLFRNLTLPGRNRADIDGVLVGPSGLWALEVKNFSGEYRHSGEHWEFRAGNRWRSIHKSPSRQAQDNAARLAGFLKADGIRQWVTPVVIWANRESPLTVENPAVAVWTMDRLPEELGNIWQGLAIDEPVRARIIEKLTALCTTKNDEESD